MSLLSNRFSFAQIHRTIFSFSIFVIFYGIFAGSLVCSVDAQETENNYHGFKIDFSQINDLPQKETVVKAVKRQIEIVEQVRLSAEILNFFKSVPIVMIPDTSGTPGIYNGEKNTVFLKGRDLDVKKPILLHEFLHAYHNLRVPSGEPKAQIRAFYQEALEKFPNFRNEYFLSNPREYFAVTASIYLFGDIPRPPFNRSAIKTAQPQYYQLLETFFGRNDDR